MTLDDYVAGTFFTASDDMMGFFSEPTNEAMPPGMSSAPPPSALGDAVASPPTPNGLPPGMGNPPAPAATPPAPIAAPPNTPPSGQDQAVLSAFDTLFGAAPEAPVPPVGQPPVEAAPPAPEAPVFNPQDPASIQAYIAEQVRLGIQGAAPQPPANQPPADQTPAPSREQQELETIQAELRQGIAMLFNPNTMLTLEERQELSDAIAAGQQRAGQLGAQVAWQSQQQQQSQMTTRQQTLQTSMQEGYRRMLMETAGIEPTQQDVQAWMARVGPALADPSGQQVFADPEVAMIAMKAHAYDQMMLRRQPARAADGFRQPSTNRAVTPAPQGTPAGLPPQTQEEILGGQFADHRQYDDFLLTGKKGGQQ